MGNVSVVYYRRIIEAETLGIHPLGPTNVSGADLQSEVGVGLPEDPLGVEVIGGKAFGPADDGVDLLRQLLGLLLQLPMLLYTETGRSH